MAVFKCKMCGGSLEIGNETVAVCEYCGTKQTLPKLSSERKAHLYDRANHFRRNNEFDKAAVIYEQILGEDNSDAESYWSLVLCRYGIEYVEDPHTHKRLPTVNRTQHRSFLQDEDYLAALQYADAVQAEVYKQEAQTIDEIQQGILAISQKEEPFDVFICYKETDPNGRRTADSVYAQDIYKALTEEGYKVFFSRITLEDKLGTAYEPYIFAALSSAKVMLVVGTKPEHFNAVWVKNEWSRYLAMMESGQKKTIVPIYADMDPYALPEELSYIQAQDLSKIGFMQDLIHGVQKIIPRQTPVKAVTGVEGQMVDSMLDKAFHFLRAKDYKSAGLCLDTVYVYNASHPLYYVGRLMMEYACAQVMDLADLSRSIKQSEWFQKALVYAEGDLRQQLQWCGEHSLYHQVFQMVQGKPPLEACQQARALLEDIDSCQDATFADELAALKSDVERKITAIEKRKLLCEQEQRRRDAAKAEEKRQNEERLRRRKKKCWITLAVAVGVAIVLLLTMLAIAYCKGNAAYAAGDYKTAARYFSSMKMVSGVADKLYQLEQKQLDTAQVGDVVTFGAYRTEKWYVPGKKPVEWIVLAKENGQALLISKQCLTAQTYHDELKALGTWKQTTLYQWLNDTFFQQAFSAQEQSCVVTNTELGSKVFILSQTEIIAYLPRDLRSAKATEYAVDQGIQVAENGNSCWWIRNEDGVASHNASPMLSTGIVGDSLYITNDFVGVRPAIWVEIE